MLYLALEDGESRIQRRLRDIQPSIEIADPLHLVYDFPLLSNGGIDKLRQYIESDHYRLIVILAMVEPAANKGSSDKGYHDIYHMFAPLQECAVSIPSAWPC